MSLSTLHTKTWKNHIGKNEREKSEHLSRHTHNVSESKIKKREEEEKKPYVRCATPSAPTHKRWQSICVFYSFRHLFYSCCCSSPGYCSCCCWLFFLFYLCALNVDVYKTKTRYLTCWLSAPASRATCSHYALYLSRSLPFAAVVCFGSILVNMQIRYRGDATISSGYFFYSLYKCEQMRTNERIYIQTREAVVLCSHLMALHKHNGSIPHYILSLHKHTHTLRSIIICLSRYCIELKRICRFWCFTHDVHELKKKKMKRRWRRQWNKKKTRTHQYRNM